MSKIFKKTILTACISLVLLFTSNDVPAEVCSVIISPASVSVNILETIQFSAVTSGDDCNEACSVWEITVRASEESTIDENGLYTAGITGGVDIITVTDSCNGDITNSVKVTVSSESDDENNCPDPNLEPTITIGECDSGVENQLFENGCTMSDMIAQCAEGAGNHGKFVSCVAHLTNDWKKDRLISGKEKGAIQRCAARSDIPSTTTTIITSVCTSDEECDDGLYCNGYETCDDDSGICLSGSDPCPDDELFCNGEESCDEEIDACTQSGDPCQGIGTCDEETKECLSESQTPTIKLIPDSALRSHLIPLPLIMVITGNNIHFNETTTVDFSEDDILLPTPLVLSPTSILLVSLINRAGVGTTGDTEVVVTVTSTSDTGVVVATETLRLYVLPGF